jgi:hypothetical protein
MGNKLTPEVMKKNLANSQITAAAVGSLVLLNGVMGITMYNSIGELKNESRDRAEVDSGDNLFIMSTVMGSVALAANMGYAVHLYNQHTIGEAWTPSAETWGFFATVTIQLLNLMYQSSMIIDIFNKVKTWNKPSKKCAEGANDDPRAKRNAEAAEGIAIATLILTLTVFIYYAATLGVFTKGRKMFDIMVEELKKSRRTAVVVPLEGGSSGIVSNAGFSTLVGGCGSSSVTTSSLFV